MTGEHRHDDSFNDLTYELRALAETLLERVEPALRRAAADDRAWDSCSWCPLCAAAALLRGEHHDVAAALAQHGTAVVTVLREALAGAPVDPVDPHVRDGAGAPDPDPGPATNGFAGGGEFGSGPASSGAPGQRAPGADEPKVGAGDQRTGYIPIQVRIRR